MSKTVYRGVDDRVTINDLRIMQFESNYRSIKFRISLCERMVVYFRKERDVYHTNFWKEKLSEVEHTLENYDFFISLFPWVIEETGFGNTIYNGMKNNKKGN